MRVALRIKGDGDAEIFQTLLSNRQKIEEAIGAELVWDDAQTATSHRILFYKDADISSPDNYPAVYAWLVEYLDRFHEVFLPYIEGL